MNANDVAAVLIRLAEVDEDAITQMQLHKLLYYVQGLSLGLRGRPVFTEAIEAWQHGPVVPAVRDRCGVGMHFSADVFSFSSEIDNEDYTFIESVWIRYRDFSASALRKMSHDETPWRDARKKGNCAVITNESMQQFFAMPEDAGFDGLRLLNAEQDIAKGRVISMAEMKKRLKTA